MEREESECGGNPLERTWHLYTLLCAHALNSAEAALSITCSQYMRNAQIEDEQLLSGLTTSQPKGSELHCKKRNTSQPKALTYIDLTVGTILTLAASFSVMMFSASDSANSIEGAVTHATEIGPAVVSLVVVLMAAACCVRAVWVANGCLLRGAQPAFAAVGCANRAAHKASRRARQLMS